MIAMKKITNLFFMTMFAALMILPSCGKEKIYNSADEWVAEVQSTLTAVTVDQLKQKIDDFEMFYLLDVREPMEHFPGFIPGSINIPGGLVIFNMNNDGFWEEQMSYTPTKEDEIIVYCKKGKRSVMAADALKKLGYTNIKFLEGGWKNWEMNYPLEYDKALEKMGHAEPAGESGGC